MHKNIYSLENSASNLVGNGGDITFGIRAVRSSDSSRQMVSDCGRRGFGKMEASLVAINSGLQASMDSQRRNHEETMSLLNEIKLQMDSMLKRLEHSLPVEEPKQQMNEVSVTEHQVFDEMHLQKSGESKEMRHDYQLFDKIPLPETKTKNTFVSEFSENEHGERVFMRNENELVSDEVELNMSVSSKDAELPTDYMVLEKAVNKDPLEERSKQMPLTLRCRVRNDSLRFFSKCSALMLVGKYGNSLHEPAQVIVPGALDVAAVNTRMLVEVKKLSFMPFRRYVYDCGWCKLCSTGAVDIEHCFLTYGCDSWDVHILNHGHYVILTSSPMGIKVYSQMVCVAIVGYISLLYPHWLWKGTTLRVILGENHTDETETNLNEILKECFDAYGCSSDFRACAEVVGAHNFIYSHGMLGSKIISFSHTNVISDKLHDALLHAIQGPPLCYSHGIVLVVCAKEGDKCPVGLSKCKVRCHVFIYDTLFAYLADFGAPIIHREFSSLSHQFTSWESMAAIKDSRVLALMECCWSELRWSIEEFVILRFGPGNALVKIQEGEAPENFKNGVSVDFLADFYGMMRVCLNAWKIYVMKYDITTLAEDFGSDFKILLRILLLHDRKGIDEVIWAKYVEMHLLIPWFWVVGVFCWSRTIALQIQELMFLSVKKRLEMLSVDKVSRVFLHSSYCTCYIVQIYEFFVEQDIIAIIARHPTYNQLTSGSRLAKHFLKVIVGLMTKVMRVLRYVCVTMYNREFMHTFLLASGSGYYFGDNMGLLCKTKQDLNTIIILGFLQQVQGMLLVLIRNSGRVLKTTHFNLYCFRTVSREARITCPVILECFSSSFEDSKAFFDLFRKRKGWKQRSLGTRINSSRGKCHVPIVCSLVFPV